MRATKDLAISSFSASEVPVGSMYAASIICDATSKKYFESGFPTVKSESLSIASLFDNPDCLSLIIRKETPCMEVQVLSLRGAAHPEKKKIKDNTKMSPRRLNSFGDFVLDIICLPLRPTIKSISRLLIRGIVKYRFQHTLVHWPQQGLLCADSRTRRTAAGNFTTCNCPASELALVTDWKRG